MVYPDTPADQVINKMQPDCLKLVTIIQKCKYKNPTSAAKNVINKDGENAYNSSFIHTKIGDSERKNNGDMHNARKPNGWLRKRVSDQVQAKSLEWIHRGDS